MQEVHPDGEAASLEVHPRCMKLFVNLSVQPSVDIKSNLIALASNLLAMASNLLALISNPRKRKVSKSANHHIPPDISCCAFSGAV